MSCEQFSDKDSSFIADALKSVEFPFGESIIIKKYSGISDNGDPSKGIQAKLQFIKTPSKAIIESMSQNDVVYSGGIYQIGDVTVTLREHLNIIDNINQTGGKSFGDRILWEGHEYRIVGKIDTQTFIGKNRLNKYVFRKIGNS